MEITMKPIKTTSKPLSLDKMSVSSGARQGGALFRQYKKKSVKQAWIAAHELWIGTLPDGQTRAVTPVTIGNCLYWMDCVTGGITWPVGTEFVRNETEASDMLLAISEVNDRTLARETDDED